MRADKAAKYLQLARAQAELFSKDPSTKVGAIFLDAESLAIRSLGYNGFPRGIDETIAARWERPAKYLWVEHAERNGIYNAVRSGVSLDRTVCIVTLFPCVGCAKGLIQSGIRTLVAPKPDFSRVTYGEEFRVALEMLTEAGIEIMYEDALTDLGTCQQG